VGLLADAFASRGALRRALRAPAVEVAPAVDLPDATVPLVDASQSD